MLISIIGISAVFIFLIALTLCIIWFVYQVMHYNIIKNELPYFDRETKKFFFDTIKKKIEKKYGYTVKTEFYNNAFYIDDKLSYTFDKLTYKNFFDFLKKRKMLDLRFILTYTFMEIPIKYYEGFDQMFNDIPNQMKQAIRKEKLMKIQSIYKVED